MNARPIRNQPSQLLEMLQERERPVRAGMIRSAYGGRIRRPLRVDY